jgi:hypothetical protein
MLGTLVSNAPNLSHLSLRMYQYRTDAFLHEEKDTTSTPSLLVSLPSMVRLPTPSERTAAVIEDDGRKYGQLFAELVTGTKLIEQQPSDIDAAIDAILGERLGLGQQAVLGDDDQRSDNNRSSDALTVQTNSLSSLIQMNKKPKYEFMTKAEWENGVSVVLASPFTPALQVLDLGCMIPCRPLRFLRGLVNLEKLCLTCCDITDATLGMLMPDIQALHSLMFLDLTKNCLTDNVNLSPLVDLPSLEKLILKQNKLGGMASTSIFTALSKGENFTLSYLDLTYNPFRTDGLSFDNLDRWAAPDAKLLIPNVFTSDEKLSVIACLPDNGTVEFVGEPFGGVVAGLLE